MKFIFKFNCNYGDFSVNTEKFLQYRKKFTDYRTEKKSFMKLSPGAHKNNFPSKTVTFKSKNQITVSSNIKSSTPGAHKNNFSTKISNFHNQNLDNCIQ